MPFLGYDPVKNLDSNKASEVASAKMLEVFIGVPPKRMIIFTGIAIPELVALSPFIVDAPGDAGTWPQKVIVNLNAKSNAPNPPFAATVGLASINNKNSDMLLATDTATVFTDDQLNLFLACDIVAMGGVLSILSRFSYQATVFLDTDVAIISGTIRWNPGDITHNSALESDLFEVEAFTVTYTPPTTGSLAGTLTRTVKKLGKTLGKPDWQGSLIAIPYEIYEPPLGEALFVSVAPKPGAFTVNSGSAGREVVFAQVSGPSPITLTPTHLKEAPVDFMARVVVGPA